jgi:homoserine kinase type II
MAVYTPVSTDELKLFLMNYDLGTLIAQEGIEAGVSNTNYFVSTTQGRFVLTLFEPHRVQAGDIPFFLNYASVLNRAGIPCPETMVRKDGAALSRLNNRMAALFSVLEGEGGSADNASPARCEAAGKILGQMHEAGGGIKEAARNHFSIPRWDLWVAMLGGQMKHIAPGLQDLTTKALMDVKNAWPSHLPQGAIHGDYFPDNVFFDGDAVTGVIDFHFVCTDLFAYDLAIALNAWCFDADNNFVQARYESFLRGYQSARALSAEEIKSLPVLLQGAALRFLLSRIEEKLKWNAGDFMVPHDPMVFEKRLKHFQGMFA